LTVSPAAGRDLASMTERFHDPIPLFRFVVRERDWTLAGLLAASLGRDRATRALLQRELRAAAEPQPPSIGALRALGRLARLLGLALGAA
jgi:hypothetical protein